MADAYDFEDEWRLTERQIKQYNEILMDSDELRKYVRLEAIQEKFEAFPPFWYFFGHTACSIAEDIDLKLEYWEREEYRRRAKEHFARYEKLNKYNILREDQIAASYALEYVDLLLMENEPNKEKVASLLKTASLVWDYLVVNEITFVNERTKETESLYKGWDDDKTEKEFNKLAQKYAPKKEKKSNVKDEKNEQKDALRKLAEQFIQGEKSRLQNAEEYMKCMAEFDEVLYGLPETDSLYELYRQFLDVR